MRNGNDHTVAEKVGIESKSPIDGQSAISHVEGSNDFLILTIFSCSSLNCSPEGPLALTQIS